ncbi:YIP1 family protein [Bacillus haynesii]|uniref:YIP1 family protein n=1 Tax=Bacillus haynesii TaxID=1925021 RepID=A0AA90E6I8_9BACI|nr:Yip1 family protein [Bacillus haynesii]MCY7792550.1 YIP1 family protein [Bacillus haynesii]MCY7860835.1 YIP1 family protein [Bacillus haynesii]MCY8001356.1 YIP1 family protein [Bacillus haynesii]MCY8006513.1 YIP1 family protein [Bacillus haynesii]MCY8014049.1 YIP1 family protein [Bacillus haynesii]
MEANGETTPQVKKPSLLGIITSPVRQFERMRERPAIWLPMIIVLALSAFSVYLVYRELSQFNIDPGMAAISKVFQMLIFFVLSALVLWLISKIGNGETSFICMVSLSVFATFVTAIRDVITSLVFYFSNSPVAFTFASLAGYIPAEEPLLSVLGMFDLFTIWSYALVAVGLQKAAGASKRASWIGVSVLFIFMLVLSYLSGLYQVFIENIQ